MASLADAAAQCWHQKPRLSLLMAPSLLPQCGLHPKAGSPHWYKVTASRNWGMGLFNSRRMKRKTGCPSPEEVIESLLASHWPRLAWAYPSLSQSLTRGMGLPWLAWVNHRTGMDVWSSWCFLSSRSLYSKDEKTKVSLKRGCSEG